MNTNRTAETLSAKKHLRRTLPAALVLLAICLVFTAPAGAAETYFPTGGDGTEASPYLITSESDLRNLSTLLSTDNTERDNYLRKHYKLTQDIALTGGEWTPIDSFSGVFDGGGHTISDMTITQINNKYLGLFEYTESSATIKNLNVKGSINIILTSEDYTPPELDVGGIVGQNRATIEDCSSDVKITGNFNIKEGDYIAVYAGGIVGDGQSGSTIRNSSAFGDIMLTSSAPDVGSSMQDNELYVGGIAGRGYAVTYIYDSYAVGNMTVTATQNARVYTGGLIGYFDTGGRCENSYATGNVEGSSHSELYVGGLVGKIGSRAQYVTNSYATGDVKADGAASATTYVGGLVGYIEAGTKNAALGINPNRISYCYALNEKITANGGTCYLNRVVGGVNKAQNDYTVDLISNHAWVNMKLNGATVTGGTASNEKGADIESSEVWNQLFGPFTAEKGWEVYTGNSDFQMPVRADVVKKPVGAEAVHLKVETFTVSFEEKGGSDVTDQTLITGGKVSEPIVPTKAGHTFEGWYTDELLTNKYDFNTPVTESFTLYANWTADTYTVTYNGNGNTSGDIPADEISYEYDTEVTVLGNTGNLGKTGYQFAGWDNDTGYTFTAEDKFKITKDTELKANWTANTTTVIFNANGGGDSGTMDNQVFKYGIPQNLQTNTFTNTSGYKFVQWNTTEGVTYQDGTEFNAGVNTAEITLYAEWARYYNVTFNSQGGSAVQLQEVKTGTPASTPTNPSKAGHNFAGWYKEAEGNNVWSFSTPITEDITLYAKWTVVNSGGNGGGSSSSGNVVRPTQPVEPIVPVEPIQPTEPVTPTEPVAPTEPTEQPKPETMPAAEAVVEETKAIELTDTNIEKLASGENVAVVELENTEVVQSVAVPEHIAAANPDASVKIAEGNAEPVTLPVGVKTEEVHIVIEVSVVDQSGDKISVDNPGYFVLKVNVPEGKQIVVGHYVDGVWENCDLMVLGNGEVMVYYNSLSPFAAIFIDEGAENPLLNQPTEPAETPAPILGMVLGGLAAAVVLRRK